MRRGWIAGVVAAGGLASCTAALEQDLEAPDADPAIARPAPRIPDAAPSICDERIAAAEGQERRDWIGLCAATGHDGSCVGFSCARTEPREAFECLLAHGHADDLFTLTASTKPAVRAYAREAIDRTNSWTLDDIGQALEDSAVVEACHGCICDREPLTRAGLTAALEYPDRVAVRPLLRRWATGTVPEGMDTALLARGEEPWIDSARLHEVFADRAIDPPVRAAAALALARRGESTPTRALYELTEDDAWQTRATAVEALDVLGVAEAWDDLAPLLRDDVGDVRTALLLLGAHHVPARAVTVIDGNSLHGPCATMALPPKWFAPRAVTAICSVDDMSPEDAAQLHAALSALPRRARCRALRDRRPVCSEKATPAARAAALVPDLVTACGLPVPPAAAPVSEVVDDRWSPCHRDRPGDGPTAAERAVLRDIERRAKAAAAETAGAPPRESGDAR
ncbi:MAG: HEAT repeat domain-containing protein [Myxococcota bacterium]